jgi:predicted porin
MTLNTFAAAITLVAITMPVHASETSADFYGSIRIGIDSVDAATDDDGGNGRDYLSRIGIKGKTQLEQNLTLNAQVEYGLRGDDAVNSSQMDPPTLRLLIVGLKGDFGTVTYGSQFTIFHQFVRSAYFSDGNDTIRLGTALDDDLTNYIYKIDQLTLAASLHTEGQDGDSLDSYSVAAQWDGALAKIQLAAVTDQRGGNTGTLMGARVWFDLGDQVTLSAYRHQQSDDFDLYSGSTGNVRLRGATINGNVNGVGNCSGEARSNTGVYAALTLGSGKLHGRYAVDQCESAGDIDSIKLEYSGKLASNAQYWFSYETLSSDEARKPATGNDMSEAQIGIRYDF